MDRPRFVLNSRHVSSSKVKSIKRFVIVSSTLYFSMMIVLAGVAGAMAHLHLMGDPSPQDTAPDMASAPGPEADAPAVNEGTEEDDALKEFLWIQGSARMGRTRGRTIQSSQTLRRNKDALDMDPLLNVDLAGPVTKSGIEDDPIFSSDGRIVISEKGAINLKEAKETVEAKHGDVIHYTMDPATDSGSDHVLFRHGLGWEGHRTHSF